MVEYYNLNEFIELYNLRMILNNDLIRNHDIHFELYNYNELKSNEEINLLDELEDEFNNYMLNNKDYNYYLLNRIGFNNDVYDYINEFDELIDEFNDRIEDIIDDRLYEIEVYQYFIVPYNDIFLWMEYTDYPIYEDEEDDLYLIGITHYGMSWDYFGTRCVKNK